MDGLGGTISVQSEGEGLGSVFTVTLPIQNIIAEEVAVSETYDPEGAPLPDESIDITAEEILAPVPSMPPRASLSLRVSKVVPVIFDECDGNFNEERRNGGTSLDRHESHAPAPHHSLLDHEEKERSSDRNEKKAVTGRYMTVGDGALVNRVLVVDDASSNRKMLCRLLNRLCVNRDEAEDGEDALEKVRQSLSNGNRYDVIFMDFVMPNKDGPTATKELREMGYKGLIMGITGNALAGDIEKFRKSGADCVLTKPIDMTLLIANIRQYLDRNGRDPQCHNNYFT